MNRFETFLVSWDIFGHAIGVNYKGDDAYRTRLGAFCTLAMYILMTINLLGLVTAYENNSKMETSNQQTLYEPFREDAFKLKDYQTEVIVNTNYSELPSRIGRIYLVQTKNCHKSTERCVNSGEAEEVLPVPCSEHQISELAEYYVPRYGEALFENLVLPGTICYDMETADLTL